MSPLPRLQRYTASILAWLLLPCLFVAGSRAADVSSIRDAQIDTLFPRATTVGEPGPDFSIRPVYQLQELIGYAFETNAVVDLPGFSGERVNLLVGLDTQGRLAGVELLQHHEPIFLHGLGPGPLLDFLEQYRGHPLNRRILLGKPGGGGEDPGTSYFDGVTKATVSVIVVNDTIVSAAREVARKVLAEFAQRPAAQVRRELFRQRDWSTLIDEGLAGEWRISREEIESRLGFPLDAFAAEEFDLAEPELRIYFGLADVPGLGRNLLGDEGFERLLGRLDEGDHAIFVMSTGLASYLEPTFRPGTSPQRISLVQRELPVDLRDMNFFDARPVTTAAGVPALADLRLFRIRPQAGFDPAGPMQLTLDLRLQRNPLQVARAHFSTRQQLPAELFDFAGAPGPAAIHTPPWLRIWQQRWAEVAILLFGLALLSAGFLWQARVTRHSRLFGRTRAAFLLFTLVFIGYYAQGQLSVVNIFTVLLALRDGFQLEVFLLDPVIFVLWCYTLVTLVLWGRGVYCGWLCPFGALQEAVARVAAKLQIRQWRIDARDHRRLLWLKYLLLGGLVAVSLVNLPAAERLAEVEPFKTAVTLNFVRELPFVLYALALLILGLFVNKFYCRYVCPLGAGLAVLGKLRRFEWLARRSECGAPCQLCRHRCGVNAIDRSGRIDYDECIQCLECVVILHDEDQCAPRMAGARRDYFRGAASASPRKIDLRDITV